jgi:hypothetical protein
MIHGNIQLPSIVYFRSSTWNRFRLTVVQQSQSAALSSFTTQKQNNEALCAEQRKKTNCKQRYAADIYYELVKVM